MQQRSGCLLGISCPRTTAPVIEIGVLYLSDQMQKGHSSCVVGAAPLEKCLCVYRKGDVCNSGKTGSSFTADACKTHLQVQPFPGSVARHGGKVSKGSLPDLGTLGKGGGNTGKGCFRCPESADAAAEESHGVHSTLVGIDTAGCLVHCLFCFQTCLTQPEKTVFRRCVRCFLPDLEALGKVRLQGCCAGGKGVNIHIPVTAAIAPIHKAGLWGGVYLGQKALISQRPYMLPVSRREMIPEDLPGDFLKLGNRVESACGAAPTGFAADDAAPQAAPFQFFSICVQHIHIKQPSQRGGFFNGGAKLLQLGSVGVYSVKCLTAGDFLKSPSGQNFVPGKFFVQ